MRSTKKIYVIAGEASGDLHGANLIKNLRALSKIPLEIYGVGGDKIRETGALEFFDLAHFHVTGLTDALKKLPQYKKAGDTILSRIKKAHPDMVVLIDNPGFNLAMAKKIHTFKIPIVYYIAPQVWAWAPKRVLTMKKTVKKVLVVFEFEKKIFEDNGVPVAWVGHPLRDIMEKVGVQDKEFEKISHSKKGALISLLPGSRKGEIKMLLSIFLKAAKIITREIPGTEFALIKSPTLPKHAYEKMIKDEKLHVSIIEKSSYSVIKASDLAIVCSGTATLECAVLGTPMIVANKGSFITYLAARSLIKVKYLGLPNLILGKEKMPELLQYDATPEKIAHEAIKILKNEKLKESLKEDLRQVSKKLGEPGAAERAATEILNILA